MQTLAIQGELYSQGIGEIQHDRSKTSHYSFGSSLQIILQAVFKLPEEEEEMSQVLDGSTIGSLMYAMVCTRPDLAYAVSTVSRFMSNSEKATLRSSEAML